jgi:type IV secretory pathway VirB4 component
MFETEVIVIDPEREYEYLAETVGGRYFNISLSSEHHINPFDLAIPREDENPGDILRNNIITLVGLFRIMLGGLTPEEDAIIDKAITETYALKDITADANFAQIEPPLLSDFELVLSGFLEYSVRMDQSESEPDYKKAQVMNRLAGLGIYNTCLMGVVTAGLDLLVNKP